MVKNTKLRPMRNYRFETLPACPGHGYEISNDWVDVRYLPERSKFIVQGGCGGTRLTLDKNQWLLVLKELDELQRMFDEAEDSEKARAQGELGYELLERLAIDNGWIVETY